MKNMKTKKNFRGKKKKIAEGVNLITALDNDEPGMDVQAIVESFALPQRFGEKVLRQAGRVTQEVAEADLRGRQDLRKLKTVTIDGSDAKDLDDAISLAKEGENYRLGVHIADVAHYVIENSALDREAKKRGTSVYLVDRVIPMLPPSLSDEICSLNAGADRLTLSCTMLVSPEGEVLEHEIAETVINIRRRLTYEAVREILEDENSATMREYEGLLSMIFLMAELAAILRRKRRKRGSIDFDFPESKILIDDKGVPYEVKAYRSNTATKLIEEFMLLCNETVAQHFRKLRSPFIYRAHDNPEPEKIAQLIEYCGNFGFKSGGSLAKKQEKKEKSKGKDKFKDKRREKKRADVKLAAKVQPRDIQMLVKGAVGTPYEATINRMTLRSMMRAEYSAEKTSPFGLASPCYCHFTSPIRRYPDLQIHRIIKDHLRGRFDRERREHYESLLAQVAKQSSERERRAEEAEREVAKMKKAEYMEAHLGETYEGVISGITGWGFYVELENTVEGLVHVSSLADDYYVYEEETIRLVGRRGGNSFRLGQAVTVWVKAANKRSKMVDFELVNNEKRTPETGSEQQESLP